MKPPLAWRRSKNAPDLAGRQARLLRVASFLTRARFAARLPTFMKGRAGGVQTAVVPEAKCAQPLDMVGSDASDEAELSRFRNAKAVRSARMRERARVVSIINAPEAVGKREAAVIAALCTNLTRSQAIAVLAAMPVPCAPARFHFTLAGWCPEP